MHSGLPALPQLEEDFTMAHGLLQIAARLHLQRRQPTVRGQQSGEHAERGFKGQNGAFPMSKTRERYSQMKVPQRQEMLQAYSHQRLFGRFMVATLSQIYDCQAQMRLWAVAIDFKRTMKSAFCVRNAP
jgi:hypothetical protein